MRPFSRTHYSSMLMMAPTPRLNPAKSKMVNQFYHFIFQVLHLLAGGRRSSAITEEPPLPGPLFLPACRPFLSLPHFSLSTSPLFPLHSFFLPFSLYFSLPQFSLYLTCLSTPLLILPRSLPHCFLPSMSLHFSLHWFP